MKRCFLFPGQGAQYPGMAKDLWDDSQAVKDLFSLASDQTGQDCRQLLFESDEEELKKTDITQLAVTLANVSALVYLREKGISSDVCAGFSLGEYSALADAGILDFGDIFKVVQKRGEIMARAANRIGPEPAGMAAVLGLDMDDAEPVFSDLAGEDVYLANHSSPSQIVIAGTSAGLEKADKLFEEAGALRFVRLKVSGPFHSPLMAEAGQELDEFLKSVSFSDPEKPVYANVTGDLVTDGASCRKLCVEQIVSPVRWVGTMERIYALDCQLVYEVGPGSVLAGLWKSFTKKVKCKPAGTVGDIKASIETENS